MGNTGLLRQLAGKRKGLKLKPASRKSRCQGETTGFIKMPFGRQGAISARKEPVLPRAPSGSGCCRLRPSGCPCTAPLWHGEFVRPGTLLTGTGMRTSHGPLPPAGMCACHRASAQLHAQCASSRPADSDSPPTRSTPAGSLSSSGQLRVTAAASDQHS